MTKPHALTRIVLEGEFSIFEATKFREMLLTALDAADEVEADLGLVTEVDSAGLQLMIAAKREARERGKVLRFTDHSPAAVDSIDLCDLSAYLGDPLLLQSGTSQRN